jgi:hypothetical protein
VSKDDAAPPRRVPASTRKGYLVAAHDESATPAEPYLVLGEFARLLTSGTAPALAALQDGLHLTAAALRDASGKVVAGTTPTRPSS